MYACVYTYMHVIDKWTKIQIRFGQQYSKPISQFPLNFLDKVKT